MAEHRNINTLTGLRGIAALWVFAMHMHGFVSHLYGVDFPMNTVLYHGYFGVDVFFILSGFIMTYVHYEDFRNSITERLKYFLTLRFWRIFPLHLAVMLAVLVAISLSADLKTTLANGNPKAFGIVSFLQSITLTQAWGFYWQGFSWNGPSWTLSAEWFDYLAFPFLIFAIRGIKPPVLNLFLGGAALVGLGLILKKVGLVDINAAHFAGVGRAVFGFTAGCFLCRFYSGFRQPFPAALLCSASLLFIAVCLYAPAMRPLIYLAFGALILSLAYMPKFYGAVFGRGISFWLGKISFSFYLTHLMILNTVGWALKAGGWNKNPAFDGLLTILTVMLCFAIAAVCYKAIERPSHRVARRIAYKPWSTATAISALEELAAYDPDHVMDKTHTEPRRRAG